MCFGGGESDRRLFVCLFVGGEKIVADSESVFGLTDDRDSIPPLSLALPLRSNASPRQAC